MKLPPPPSIVDLELTNRCQLRCRMCPHAVMKRPQGFMDLAIVEKVARELSGKTERAVLHQIGEPLLHPEWRKAVQIVADAGIRPSFSTNGLLLDRQNIVAIVDSPMEGITVCLDGVGETYRENRGGASFDTVAANLEALIHERQAVGGGPEIVVQVLNMVSAAEVVAIRERFEPLLKGVGHIYLKDYATWTGDSPNFGKTPAPRVPLRYRCSKPWQRVTVQWNGDATVCCRDYDGLAVMGNVRKANIVDIWHCEAYRQFRESLRARRFHRLCKDCVQ